eukprot:m.190042 g.190042  ORF g.190042 m.190042 type:complete len:452 (-) comp17932_c0_seq1:62-1417(-)
MDRAKDGGPARPRWRCGVMQASTSVLVVIAFIPAAWFLYRSSLHVPGLTHCDPFATPANTETGVDVFLRRESRDVSHNVSAAARQAVHNADGSHGTRPVSHSRSTVAATTGTFTGYIELSWFSHHAETAYTYFHYMCGNPVHVSPPWPYNRHTGKRAIYLGPPKFVNDAMREIWTTLNSSDCPLYFDTPKDPNLTVRTTWKLGGQPPEKSVSDPVVNDPRFILINHDPSKRWCKATKKYNLTNVYGLTPKSPNYILPFFFPPAYTAVRTNYNFDGTVPVFMVQGGHSGGDKRNYDDLVWMLKAHANRSFIVRVMGGVHPRQETVLKAWKQVEFVTVPANKTRLDSLDWMLQMHDVYGILPLVDNVNFYERYKAGYKLSSSVSWGVGFNMTFVCWTGLAELFGLGNNAYTYDQVHNARIKRELDDITKAFGDALDDFEKIHGTVGTPQNWHK